MGWEDPLGKEMATHSSILAWKISWTEETGGLQSMRFSRQGYWSRLSFPSPGDLPNPGIEAGSPALQTDSLPTELQGKPTICSSPNQNKFFFHVLTYKHLQACMEIKWLRKRMKGLKHANP